MPYRVVLIGAGVVGRAIARAHLDCGMAVEMVDVARESLDGAAAAFASHGALVTPLAPLESGGERVRIAPPNARATVPDGLVELLVIESIVERREAKRELIHRISNHFGDRAVFATNTSSLRLSDLEDASDRPDRFCGLHFFMPVVGRDLVEVVRAPRTSDETIELVRSHAARIGKRSLVVADSPGFVVNRILTPYLNQSLLMIGAGADHNRIRRCATQFGMAMSPLEMVDMIGTRTAFDAGRAAWQAFPDRIDPAPVLPGIIKAGLPGRSSGRGFYLYDSATSRPSEMERLNPAAAEVIARYQRDPREWTDQAMQCQLCVPMLIEAAHVIRQRIVRTTEEIELAMHGGLGFQPAGGFFGAFDSLGIDAIVRTLEAAGERDKALRAPADFRDALRRHKWVADAVEDHAIP